MGKIHLKADCGTSYLRLSAEADVDVPDDSPVEVKKAAGPMFAALRDSVEEALQQYRVELAGAVIRGMPDQEHRRQCRTCPEPAESGGGTF